MSRLFLFILFVVSCHSQGDSCQDMDKPPNPMSGCCGIQLGSDLNKTIGGATNDQLPWLVLVEAGEKNYTGTLISSRHVLTTALIIDHHIVKVRLGVYDHDQTSNDHSVTIAAASASVHYTMINLSDFTLQVYDIAIITLAEKAPYNDFIRPICLPTSDVVVSPPDNLRFVNAGWLPVILVTTYSEEIFRKVYKTLPYINLKKCQEIYRSNPNTSFMVVDSGICAGGAEGFGTSKKEIDNGGPLMLKENSHYTVVGINAGYPFVMGMPIVFTNVYPYLPWINSVTAKL